MRIDVRRRWPARWRCGLNGYLASTGRICPHSALPLPFSSAGPERAQQAFRVDDGIFQQLLHGGFDVAFGIDAEGLRHLARGDFGLRWRCCSVGAAAASLGVPGWLAIASSEVCSVTSAFM